MAFSIPLAYPAILSFVSINPDWCTRFFFYYMGFGSAMRLCAFEPEKAF
ncbi:hypothetical protein [Oxalobacter formigenes]|nr:hypothetical protein [Oxalobacter formigenes]WAW07184.1 hypothetical protein NB638_06475 [Oxalobacter formigenes]